jgi:hypothetical protein
VKYLFFYRYRGGFRDIFSGFSCFFEQKILFLFSEKVTSNGRAERAAANPLFGRKYEDLPALTFGLPF